MEKKKRIYSILSGVCKEKRKNCQHIFGMEVKRRAYFYGKVHNLFIY